MFDNPTMKNMNCRKCKKEIPDNSAYCNFCGIKQNVDIRKTLKRPNGTGSVYKLSGRRKKPWAAMSTKYINNIRKTIPVGYYETRTEALNALSNFNANPVSDLYNATLEDIFHTWSQSHYENLTANGITGYEAAWKYLMVYRHEKMRDIRTAHFQTVIDNAVEQNKSRSICEKIKQLCSQLCKTAMQNDLINKNYAQFIKLPKSVQKEKSIFTLSEIDFIKKHDYDETARIILTLIYSGMRISELFNILHENVYLEERYMIGGEKTEAGRNRIIPIHHLIMPYIESWYKQGGKYLVSSSTGKRIDSKNFRSRKFYPFLESLGIIEKVKTGSQPRLTPHSTRHTFISMMIDQNAKPELLQRIVGHEQYETTVDFYNHITKEDIGKLVSEIDLIK